MRAKKRAKKTDNRILYAAVVIVIIVAVVLGWSVITPEGRWRWGCSMAFLSSGRMPPGCEKKPVSTPDLEVHVFDGIKEVKAIATVAIGLGDANWNGVIDQTDISICGDAYGSWVGDPDWNPECDFNFDDLIDMRDITWIALNYGDEIEISKAPFVTALTTGTYTLRAKYGDQIQNKVVSVVEGILTRVDFKF